MYTILKPNTDERKELVDYVCEQSDRTRHEASGLVHAAHIAIFPDYVSCLTDAASKIMVVVWDAGPQYHRLFTWRNGRLVPLIQELLFSAQYISAHYRRILAEVVRRHSQRR